MKYLILTATTFLLIGCASIEENGFATGSLVKDKLHPCTYVFKTSDYPEVVILKLTGTKECP